jgi:NTP pyrophosphatase (non-canonical NTP hydrolase)
MGAPVRAEAEAQVLAPSPPAPEGDDDTASTEIAGILDEYLETDLRLPEAVDRVMAVVQRVSASTADRLRTEVERLKGLVRAGRKDVQRGYEARDTALREVERLRAELANERADLLLAVNRVTTARDIARAKVANLTKESIDKGHAVYDLESKLAASEQREARLQEVLRDVRSYARDTKNCASAYAFFPLAAIVGKLDAALSAPPAPAETARKRDEPCKCGKVTLKDWWKSVTDAGNEGTDYLCHTRTACLTKTERAATCTPSPSVATAPAAQDGGERNAGRWRPEVVAFADAMERQLRANDHKGGWRDEHHDDLLARLREETEELAGVLDLGQGNSAHFYPNDPNGPKWSDEVRREAADVANFAMMIADVCDALPASPAPKEST